jgi:hypothetical protein
MTQGQSGSFSFRRRLRRHLPHRDSRLNDPVPQRRATDRIGCHLTGVPALFKVTTPKHRRTEVAMAIPFEGQLQMRRTAPFHVQLELETPHEIQPMAGERDVRGRAIRVFRTDGRLTVGDRLTFTIWVCNRGDEPTGPAYMYFDTFATAKYMEVYLCGNPPSYTLAAYEFSVIRAPSDEPTLTTQDLERQVHQLSKVEAVRPRVPKAAGWWQFWKR